MLRGIVSWRAARAAALGVVALALAVRAAAALTFAAPGSAIFPVGIPIRSSQFAASGNPAPTFSATGLPSWATLSSAGVLRGTPPRPEDTPFTVTITASNGVDPDISHPFTFRIHAPVASHSGLASTTVAGMAAASGSADGAAAEARFNQPFGVAMDQAGNLFVADRANHTIRKITPSGTVTTLAGRAGESGFVNGTGGEARFNRPAAVAVDLTGNVYVADTMNSLIRKISGGGVVTTLAGNVGSNLPMPGRTLESVRVDGFGSEAGFGFPDGIAVAADGTIYVGDNLTVRKITPSGQVTTLAGQRGSQGSADGIGTEAQFRGASGIALDGLGNLYVADTHNHTIRKVTAAGQVTTLAGLPGVSGFDDGVGLAARFWQPVGVALDAAGNIFVGDLINNTVRKIAPDRQVSTLAGSATAPSGSADGSGVRARFSWPSGVVVNAAGQVFVTDSLNNMIRRITPTGEATTFAGPRSVGSANGLGADARFSMPKGIAVDGGGNLYVADAENFVIRKISSAGAVTTLAGRAGETGYADGPGHLATFGRDLSDGTTDGPTGVAVDQAGNVYVADAVNAVIRKIAPDGTVTTLAGLARNHGTVDGAGAAARFTYPFGLAVDAGGNVFVTDAADSVIRKITPAGVVTTLAGKAGVTGSENGTGEDAHFNFPAGVAVAANGDLYVADCYNHTIRRVTPDGTVTTIAGTTGVFGSDNGPATAARFYYPTGVALDTAGNVYVADSLNGSIRKITPAGVVTNEMGYGIGTTDGVGSQITFNNPYGVAVDAAGTIYVADTLNNTIRKAVGGAPAFTTWPLGQTVEQWQTAVFSISASGQGPLSYQWYRHVDFRNSTPIPGATGPTLVIPAASQDDWGFYQVTISNSLGTISSTLVPLEVVQPGTFAPLFSLSPVDTRVAVGQRTTLTAKANGSPTLVYQWQRAPAGGGVWTNLAEGGVYIGTTSPELSIVTVVSAMNGGRYRCLVTNPAGSATSNVATLQVIPAGGADFNRDGNMDVLWQNTVTGQRALWLMSGAEGGYRAMNVVSLGWVDPAWAMAGATDFNADGKIDILWQNTTTGQRALWLMNGGDFTPTQIVSLGWVDPAWSMAAAMDFNVDGKIDILWQNTVTGQRALWLMNGGDFTPTQIVSLGWVDPAWEMVAARDFNVDGKMDILWQNTVTGQRALWLMNGGDFTPTQIVSLGWVDPAWSMANAADFNADGKMDISWQNRATGQRALWLMNGGDFMPLNVVNLEFVPREWVIVP